MSQEEDGFSPLFPTPSAARRCEYQQAAAVGWDHQQPSAGVWARHRIHPPINTYSAPAMFDGTYPDPMDSQKSFTDLLTDGYSPTAFNGTKASVQKDVLMSQSTSTGKVAQKRSKNFTKEEDVLLVSAWLTVSLDPVQGADQTKSKYWSRIYEYFHSEKNFVSDRTEKSLVSRWQGIQHDVNLFSGCVAKIDGRNQSGTSMADKEKHALAMFKAEDRQQRDFPFMHCWKILKEQPKWMNRTNLSVTTGKKKPKTTSNSSPATATPLADTANGEEEQTATATICRPTGKKKEKDNLRKHSNLEAFQLLLAQKKEHDMEKDLKKEERLKKSYALQEEKIKLEKEKVEIKRREQDEKIITADTSNMSDTAKLAHEMLLKEIIARRTKD